MVQDRITKEDMERVLLGERLVLTLSGGRLIAVWRVGGRIHLTPAGNVGTLIQKDTPGEGVGEVSPL